VREAGAATWWCLGDLVGYGADPSHCLRTAIAGADRCIAGNHDLGAAGEVPLETFAPWAQAALSWTQDAIGAVGQANLERLEPQDLEGPVPLYHASPRDPVWEYVLEISQARAALEHRRVPLTLIGHTHVPFAWRLTPDGAMEAVGVPKDGRLVLDEGRWLVNPGSVGQPRDGDARAAWAIYDDEAGVIEFRRTPYDVAAAQNAILEAGLPSLLAHRLAEGR
jgi:diadenosine tetraphosphatase ApaH/serine/threonine PP2A family protein phosphatase